MASWLAPPPLVWARGSCGLMGPHCLSVPRMLGWGNWGHEQMGSLEESRHSWISSHRPAESAWETTEVSANRAGVCSRSRPNSGASGPTSSKANLASNLAEFGQNSAMFGQIRAKLGRSRAELGPTRPNLQPSGPNSLRFQPTNGPDTIRCG